MISSLTFPISDVQVIPTGNELRPRYAYENGQRTDRLVTDDKGRALYSVEAVVHAAETGDLGSARVVLATDTLPPLQFGQVLRLSPDAVLTVRRANGDFGLSVSVQASGFAVDKG